MCGITGLAIRHGFVNRERHGALRRSFRRLVSAFVATALLLAPLPVLSEQPRTSRNLNGTDAQLKFIFEKVERRQLGAALDEVDTLIARHPNFRLAYLVRGDLLLARARPIDLFGNTGHAGRERLDELRAEAGFQPKVVRRLVEVGAPRRQLHLVPRQR